MHQLTMIIVIEVLFLTFVFEICVKVMSCTETTAKLVISHWSASGVFIIRRNVQSVLESRAATKDKV